MISDTDLDKLAALAAAAKPSIFGRHSKANYAFIRACSPKVITALINRVKEAEADVEEIKDFRDGYKEIANLERTRKEAAEARVRELEAEKCTHGQHLFVEADRAIGRALAAERRATDAEAREQALRDRVLGERADAWDVGYLRGQHPWTRNDEIDDPIPTGVSPPRGGRNANPYRALLSPPTADAQVCIAHGRYVPCRLEGEHRYSTNPFWVKSVADFQGSTIEGLTWEPAWEDL
jgi:hypothetical protein